MSLVCVDSGVALALVLPDAERPRAAARWNAWRRERTEWVAPWNFPFEVRSVLRQRWLRGDLSESEARDGARFIDDLGVRTIHDDRLFDVAWDLAVTYAQPTVYDAAYLALARLLKCEWWTLDGRFAAALHGREPLVRTL